MDGTLLLPPADTPMSGIDFTRRLPCGDTEKARMVRRRRREGVLNLYFISKINLSLLQAMRVFFALREFTLELEGTEEKLLPLTPRIASVATEDLVPTSTSQNSSQSNADIIHCSTSCVCTVAIK